MWFGSFLNHFYYRKLTHQINLWMPTSRRRSLLVQRLKLICGVRRSIVRSFVYCSPCDATVSRFVYRQWLIRGDIQFARARKSWKQQLIGQNNDSYLCSNYISTTSMEIDNYLVPRQLLSPQINGPYIVFLTYDCLYYSFLHRNKYRWVYCN